MKLLDNQDADNLRKIFERLDESVNIVIFRDSREDDVHSVQDLMQDVSDLSSKIHLTCYDSNHDYNYAKKLGIDMYPAIAILDKLNKDTGIRFYGAPLGQQIHPFITSILEVSGVKDSIPRQVEKRLKRNTKRIKIDVYVDLKCTHSPVAVMAAQRLALESDLISAEMIDCHVFPKLAKIKNITGTPTVVVNNTKKYLGAQNFSQLLSAIYNAKSL